MKHILLLFLASCAMFAQGLNIINVGNRPENPSVSFTSATTATITHNLNTLNVIVECRNGSGATIANTISAQTVNSVTVTFSSSTGRCVVNGTGGVGPAGPAGADGAAGPAGPAGDTSAILSGNNVFTGSNNFSGATATRTIKEVVTAPSGACTQAAGLQILMTTGVIYGCPTGTNTWSIVSGSGGGTYTAGLGIALAGNQFSADQTVMASLDAVKVGSMHSCITASASATVYTCAPLPLPLSDPYVRGSRISFTPDVTCNATATLAISGFAARPLRRANGDGVLTGDCAAGVTYTAHLDDTGGWRLQGVAASTVYDPSDPRQILTNFDFCEAMYNTPMQGWGFETHTVGTSVFTFPKDSSNFCSWRLTTGSTIDNHAALIRTGGQQPAVDPRVKGSWKQTVVLKTNADITNMFVGTGWATNTNFYPCRVVGSQNLDCFGWVYEPSESANWVLRSCAVFVCTDRDSGVAVAANTVYTLVTFMDGSLNTIRGAIGTAFATPTVLATPITTNIPRLSLPTGAEFEKKWSVGVRTLGAAARSIDLLKYNFTGTR